MKLSKEIKSGVIAIVAIALIIWGYNFLQKQNLFDSSRIYYSEFTNIQGLTTASIVSINGFQVGNVQSIRFNPKKKGNLIVGFSINNDFKFSKNSTTKITPALMGGAELSIVPKYDGENASSGTYLIGSSEQSMMSSLSKKLTPIEEKLNTTLLDADKLLVNLNTILDEKTQQNLKSAITNLNVTLRNFKNASVSLDGMLVEIKPKLSSVLDNVDGAARNLKTVTADFEKAHLGDSLKQTVTKLNAALTKFDNLLANIDSGDGTIGKLLKDEGLYNNLENASKELEELLREVKEHPKRFVHLSLFGKKDKRGYVRDTTRK